MNVQLKNVFSQILGLIAFCLIMSSCKNGDDPVPTPTFSITIEEENTHPTISQEGGTITIPFTATGNWTASLMNDRADGWITLTPSSGDAGDVLLSITTTANDTYDERNATIVLKCGNDIENIVITQKQKDAILVSSSKYEVEADGGDISVEVQANISYDVEVKADWIKQVGTRSLTTSTLNFSIDPNETGERREGEIVISNGELSETIKVYQSYNDFITLTQKEFTLPEEGGMVDIEIRSTVDYGSKILGDVDWINETPTRAVSTHTLHYEVAPNESYDAREAKIVFYNMGDETLADTVSIYQMYKGAILVAKNEYEFDIHGGNLNFTVKSNLEYEVIVSDEWIQQMETRSLIETELYFTIAENTEGKDREGTITVKDKNSNKKQTVTIKQSYTDLIREALIALYRATDGDNWTNNKNWCSDKPITEWYGIIIEQDELYIALGFNNLRGHIPDEIYSIKNLNTIDLSGNEMSGEISEDIKNLKQLKTLRLCYNNFSGNIPSGVGMLSELETLELQENSFSGEFPDSFDNLTKLQMFRGDFNEISGDLPHNIGNFDNLEWLTLNGNKLSGEVPKGIWALNNLKILGLSDNSFSGTIPQEIEGLKKLESLSLSNNNFEGKIPEWIADLPLLQSCSLRHNYFTGHISTEISRCNNWKLWTAEKNIVPQKNNYELTIDYYASTDFSEDGKVMNLQTHVMGNGVKVVFMGDLFVDLDMEPNGLYETVMRESMETFFSVEPTKSLRELFDVYCIKAVSKNDYFGGETAFSTDLPETGIYAFTYDHDKVIKYIQEALNITTFDDVLAIIVINSYVGAHAICYYWENNFNVACCQYQLKLGKPGIEPSTLQHEAIGHGLATLHDEYIEPELENESISEEGINSISMDYNNYGYWANVDFTSDPTKVKWAHFIADSRYAAEEIGVYEGARWGKGIYRPTKNNSACSIMDGGVRFNAPSREAIYKRVMKLAYGDSWMYDYEDFVKFDAPTLEEINKEAESRSIQYK